MGEGPHSERRAPQHVTACGEHADCGASTGLPAASLGGSGGLIGKGPAPHARASGRAFCVSPLAARSKLYDTRYYKRLMGSADPNPAWTRAPWAGVPQPASLASSAGARAAPLRAAAAAVPDGVDAALADAARMPPPPPRLPFRPRSAAPDTSDWQLHFNASVDVPVGRDVFRVYLAGSSGPLVLALHGAGCTALSFAAAAPQLAAAASCRVAAVVRLSEHRPLPLARADARLLRTCEATAQADVLTRPTSVQRRALAAAPACSPPELTLRCICAAAGGRRACSGARAACTLRRG